MATSKEYIDFVRGQIAQYGEPAERKMFGEYMVILAESQFFWYETTRFL